MAGLYRILYRTLRRAVRRLQLDLDIASLAADGCNCGSKPEVNAVGPQLLREQCRQLGIIPRQNARLGFDQGDLAAKTLMCLRHFHPDRPCADDGEVARRLGAGKQGFVGQERYAVEAGNGGNGRGRSCGNDEVFGPNAAVTGLNSAGVDETSGVADDAHAEALKALLAVVGLDPLDGPPHVRHGAGVVDLRLGDRNPERSGASDQACCVGDVEQGFGWHAADVEAVAPHGAALDQHGFRAQLGRAGSHVEPSRPGADDTDVCADVFHGLDHSFPAY